MLRIIGGVIGGFAALFACLFALFTPAYLVLGADGAFQPGSYEVSGTWIILSVIVSAIGAVVGGFACKLIAGKQAAVWILIALFLALSANKIISEQSRIVPPRAGNVANIEAMNSAKFPTWLLYVMPLISVAGLLAGARLKQD